MNSSFLVAPARGVFADRQARCVFLFSMFGRSTYGILPLALILSVQQATGRLSIAGVAAAGSALGTLVMPWQARLIDAYGIRHIVRPLAVALGLLLVVLFAAVETEAFPAYGFVMPAVLLGPCSPALGPATRAFWRQWSEHDPSGRRPATVWIRPAKKRCIWSGP